MKKKRGNEQNISELSEVSLFETDLLDISKYQLEETEIDRIVKARLGHSMFKKQLHTIYKKCALCDIKQSELLIASHIKPWSQSNSQERLDIYNGLLLCPNHDLLFDRGYITFNSRGETMISTRLDKTTKGLLGVENVRKIKLHMNSQKYMEWHYYNLFKW